MTTYATTAEILETFASLSDDDLAIMRKAARMHLHASRFTEPLDLIHETLNLLLDGRRNWPKHMEFGPFMFATMRSVANSDRQLHEACMSIGASVEDMFHAGAHAQAFVPSVEEQLLAKEPRRMVQQAAREARDALDGDPDAQSVIDGMLADLSSNDIRADAKMSHAAYESARKRAARRLKKAIEGRLH